MSDFAITPLSSKPELMDVCVAWSYGEWGSQIPTRTLMQVYEDYKNSITDESLPITWVALYEGKKPAGMIRLKEIDHIEREDLKPWLSSLYVHPLYRGQGLSNILCQHLEDTARDIHGYEEVYLYTGIAEKLYAKRGYVRIGSVEDRSGHGNDKALMMKKLNGEKNV